MDLRYDSSKRPRLAVGRGAASLTEPREWVRATGTPMLYVGDGSYVVMHCYPRRTDVEERRIHAASMEEALAVARVIVTDIDPEKELKPRSREVVCHRDSIERDIDLEMEL